MNVHWEVIVAEVLLAFARILREVTGAVVMKLVGSWTLTTGI
jgi:hypothetical protein